MGGAVTWSAGGSGEGQNLPAETMRLLTLRTVTIQFHMNMVVVVMLRSRENHSPVHFTEPLPVAKNDSLNLINLAVFYTPVEQPIAEWPLVRVRVADEDVGRSTFKMHVRSPPSRVSLYLASCWKVVWFLWITPGWAATDNVLNEIEDSW